MGESINETVKLILSLSVSGGLFALVLFALKPFMRNRLSKSFQYYIWLVVLLRFIVPFSFGINLMDFTLNAPNEPQAVEETVMPNYNLENPVNVNPAINNAVNNNEPVMTEQQPSASVTTDGTKQLNVLQTLEDNLLWIWLVGALISTAWNMLGYLRFIRYVYGAAYAVEMPAGGAKVYKSRFAPTPMLVGLFKPRIYLPDIEYTDGRLDNILLHELTHLRRRDVWLKWFAAMVVSVHWFNPIAYFMRREFNRACELSCDEAVIRKLDGAAKQSYGDTLISVVAESRYPVGVMSVTMCEEKKKLKERLIAIMSYKKKTKIAVMITAVLAVMIAGSALVFGADILSTIPKTPPVIKILANGSEELPYITNTLDIPYDPQFDPLYVSNTIRETSIADETLISSLQIPDMPGAGIQLDFGRAKPDSVQIKYRFVRLESDGRYSCDFGGTYDVGYVNRNSKFVLQHPTIPVARQNDDKIVGRLYIISATWKSKTFEYAFILGCDIIREMAAQEKDHDISIADLRQLAAKGDALQYSDFPHRGLVGLSAIAGGYNPVLYGVEGGYRLLINFNDTLNPESGISSTALESIWESGGNGIDIRYNDVDEFIRTHPSHPAGTAPPTSYTPREWINRQNLDFSATTTVDLMLDEFPGVMFSYTPEKLTATDKNGTKELFGGTDGFIFGGYIGNLFLADLNGDGLPEFYGTTNYGSGFGDNRVIIYDYANDKRYVLSDRGTYDYFLQMENGQLEVIQTEPMQMSNMPRGIGNLAIINGELVVFGIDRAASATVPKETMPPEDSPATRDEEIETIINSTSNIETINNISSENISIFAENCNIKMDISLDGNFQYDYDNSLFEVKTNTNGSTITIIAKPKVNAKVGLMDMITIYIPDQKYNSITVDSKSAGITIPPLNTIINVTSDKGAVGIRLPNDFNKTVNYTATNASGAIDFDKDTTNFTLIMSVQNSSINIAKDFPQYKNGSNYYEYKNDSGFAMINIDIKDSSFAIRADE